MPEMTFAEKLAKLEDITKKLENGETSLEQAINLYEEGKKYSKELTELLEQAKLKIEVVS